MEQLVNMTILQLREEAKARGLKGVSSAKKQELISMILADRAKKKKEEEAAKAPQEQGSPERPSQTRPMQDNRAAQERAGSDRPAQDRAAQERAGSDRPMQTRPMKDRVTQERTGSDRPMQARPAQDRVMQDRPMRERPVQDRVAQERMMQDRPAQDSAALPKYDEKQLAIAEINRLSAADMARLDSGETREGILEAMPEFGFIRSDNFLSGSNDVYVSMAQIKRFGLKTGDIICGNIKVKTQSEKFVALLYIKSVNGIPIEQFKKRKNFEELTPIFPNERIHLETPGCSLSMRMVDLISPIGKGQRGMIVSQPKAGKTTLLKQIAKSITMNHPDMHLIILLIDERPEEVTDIKESIEGDKVMVIYSTFDELPDKHKKVSEMVIEHAKRLVEQKEDVIILLDSITRLARAYNLTVTASGRTLSGGLDPAALYMPKKFFGAARNMREGGSLTVLATALVETGSRMDDVVFEEFKGTGNMELQLDRNLSERRIFPAIDLLKSSTRRDDLLLNADEQEAVAAMRRMFNGARSEEYLENIIKTFQNTKNNKEFIEIVKKNTTEKR